MKVAAIQKPGGLDKIIIEERPDPVAGPSSPPVAPPVAPSVPVAPPVAPIPQR